MTKEYEFKEKMRINFIPRIEKMLEKEKQHLQLLNTIPAPFEWIEQSQKMVEHYTLRLGQYKNFVK